MGLKGVLIKNIGYFILKSVNIGLQKVQKTVIFSPFFAQKSYGGELRAHAYHNNNSAPSNDTISRSAGLDTGRAHIDRHCMPHNNTKSRLHKACFHINYHKLLQ